MPTVFNAANEKAVALFLKEKIRFLQITEIIRRAMEEIPCRQHPDLKTILDTEQAVYEFIESRW